LKNSSTRDFLAAAGIGAISGIRSLSGAMAVSHSLWRGRGSAALKAMALGEMIADKLPMMPPRVEAVPLAGRAVLGGGSAAAAMRGQSPASRAAFFAVGALCAVAAAQAIYRVRGLATRRGAIPGLAAGLLEDALVGSAALWLARRLGGAGEASTQPV
jgi:uncharacterized membrane protein